MSGIQTSQSANQPKATSSRNTIHDQFKKLKKWGVVGVIALSTLYLWQNKPEVKESKEDSKPTSSWFNKSIDSDIKLLDMNQIKLGETVTVTHRLDDVVVIIKKPNRDTVKTYWVCGKVKNEGYQTPEGLIYDYEVINNVYEISHLRLAPKVQEDLRKRGVTNVRAAFKDGWEPC